MKTQFYIIGGLCTALLTCQPAMGASGVGDVVGKVSVGYQGWFACAGDGSPMNNWWHWANNWGQAPSPSNNGIKAWPDMREYTSSYQTAFSNLGNGQPAKLFSSYDQQTVNTHALWLQQNGIDTMALQRFNPNGGESNRDGMATKVRTAAETYGRKFYIMYDVTGWTAMQSEIKTDWTSKMSALTASSAYAKQNGKPVVAIWGLCMNDANHPWTASVCLDVVNWFKNQGCYVIGGTRRDWRTADANYLPVYHAMNMISPWLIGAVGNVSDADNIYNNLMVGDQADCNANGVDYQPCVLPGDVSIHGQRSHGDLMWRMFYNAKRVGCQGIYISMFDEFNEGNQICKTAETAAMVPTGAGFLALDEDGTYCTSDYYLRLTGDGGKMLKGTIGLTSVRPTLPGGSSSKRLVVGTTVSLKAVNGKYVCAANAGTNALIASSTAVGQWESFTVADAGSGNIFLIALANNKYVCAENAGATNLIANRTAGGPWETFTEYDAGNGNIALMAGINSKYVCAENAGTNALIANRAAIGGWETFTPAVVSGASVTFYQDTSYGGTAGQGLAKGTYTTAQLTAKGVSDNWASSVKIPSGWTVIMYANDNFGGTSWTLTSDTPNFTTLSPSANDQMSSCKIQ